jgi:hypothetical protein
MAEQAEVLMADGEELPNEFLKPNRTPPEQNGDNDAPAETSEDQSTDEEKARARKMGWTPKDEFRGDPDKWRDAREFLERGDNMLPIMRERQGKLERRIEELESTLKEFGEYHKKVHKNAYEKALAEIKDEQRAAVEDGDIERFDAAEKKLEDLESSSPGDPPPASPGRTPPPGMPTPEMVKKWEADNSWYGKDKELSAYADAQGAYLREARPELEGQDWLNEITEEVQRRFPEKFQNERRQKPGPVDPGGDPASGSPSGKGKGYSDLPPSAKRQCDRFLKEGAIDSREEYAKEWFSQGIEVET